MKCLAALVFLISLALFPRPAHAAEKEWTFLLFLNGNNDLDTYGALNINQMEEVGSTPAMNLVVQWASIANGDTRRLLVKKDSDKTRVTSPVIRNMGKVDMGDHRSLEDFLRWGISAFPAKRYFVAVWNHGSGWRKLRSRGSNDMSAQDISFDDVSGNHITTRELGTVINNVSRTLGRKLDLYGSDACLMGMVDIAGEMKDSVDFFLGSQDLEPGEGWPYKEVFAGLAARPNMNGREFASLLTEEYTKSYSGGSNGKQEVTMSAFDMAHYGAVVTAVSDLGAEIRRLPAAAKPKVFATAEASLAFAYEDYVDLGDFLKRMGKSRLRGLDTRVIMRARTALDNFVVITRNNGKFAKATGAAIWIPKSRDMLEDFLDRYKALEFDHDTSWSSALIDFVGKK